MPADSRQNIQQFSGIADQNDVDIYEGDFVRVDLDHNYGPGYKEHALFEVVSRRTGFVIDPIYLPSEGYTSHFSKGKRLCPISERDSEDEDWKYSWPLAKPLATFSSSLYIVAGNTFENPEWTSFR